MPYLTQLANVARRTGYPVVEVPGWKTRGHGEQPHVYGIVCHHTGGWDDRRVVVEGRSDLDGPLSHFWLEHTGRIHVVAAGRCWHNAPSTSQYHSNSNSLGIEAENRGTGAPWPADQLDSYKKLCAELCKEFDLPATRIKGHKEVNDNKDDPKGINMNDFRADVAELMSGQKDYWTVTYKDHKYTVPWATPVLRKGSDGTRVKWLQKSLNALGATLVVDGDFGEATDSALKSFQRKYKDEKGNALDVDGIYGHHTARALFMALGGKKEDAV